MNFATFTPINLKATGPQLDEFLRLLQAALEHREVGSSTKLNAKMMASMLANGAIEATMAVVSNIPVGLQVWESGTPWFDTARQMALLRLQYLEANFDRPQNHVQFLQAGIQHSKLPGKTAVIAVDNRDQLAGIASQCGLKSDGSVYVA